MNEKHIEPMADWELELLFAQDKETIREVFLELEKIACNLANKFAEVEADIIAAHKADNELRESYLMLEILDEQFCQATVKLARIRGIVDAYKSDTIQYAEKAMKMIGEIL